MATGGDSTRGSWDPLSQDPSRRIVPTPQYSSALAADIADWLNVCQRTAKALRVYDRNNTMIHQFMDRAFGQLTSILEKTPEILLTVREDRLRWERDPVLINADRHDGIPFILYRNAFRRLTFEHGMTRQELLDFLSAVTVDFSAFDQTGEDLLTVLWRLKLPHLRYFTIDALSTVGSSSGVASVADDSEVDRIQGDIDNLVARIYGQTEVEDSDLVKGVSITREDLEALKEIRAGGEELEGLEQATARAVIEIPRRDLATIKTFLEGDDRDALVARLLDVLLHLLFHDRSSINTAKLLDLVQQLFDSILLAGKLGQATTLMRRLRDAESSVDLQAVHVSKHLIKLLVSETRTAQMLGALNEGKHAMVPQEVLELLRTIGPSVAPALLELVDRVTSAGNRRLVCDLIVELGAPAPATLLDRLQRSSLLVALDLLSIAQRLPRDELAPILLWAVEHEAGKVRALALGLLRPFPSGVADELVVRALRDADPGVRATAYRLIGLRKHVSYRSALEGLLRAEDELWSRDARELLALMLAYATVAGDEGVAALEKVLNPGFFARSKMTNAQVAAAVALGRIGSPTAKEALGRGQRTINSKVRDACRRALARELEPDQEVGEELVLTPSHGTALPELLAQFSKDRPSDMDMASDLMRGNDDPLERARLERGRPKEASPVASSPRTSRAALDTVGVVRRATPSVDTLPDRVSLSSVKVDRSGDRGSRGSMPAVEGRSGSSPSLPAVSQSGAREIEFPASGDLAPSGLSSGAEAGAAPAHGPPAPRTAAALIEDLDPMPGLQSHSHGPLAPPPPAATPSAGSLAPRGPVAPPPPAVNWVSGVSVPRNLTAPPPLVASGLGAPSTGIAPPRGATAAPPVVMARGMTPAPGARIGYSAPPPPSGSASVPHAPASRGTAPIVPASLVAPAPVAAPAPAPAVAALVAAPVAAPVAAVAAPPWELPPVPGQPEVPTPSETPVQGSPAFTSSAQAWPADVLDRPTPGRGLRVPTPEYGPTGVGSPTPAAPLPDRGVVDQWVPRPRGGSIRSSTYGPGAEASPGADLLGAPPWGAPAVPALPPLPALESMPGWMSPRSSGGASGAPDDLAAWALAMSQQAAAVGGAPELAPPASAAAAAFGPPPPLVPPAAAFAPPPLVSPSAAFPPSAPRAPATPYASPAPAPHASPAPYASPAPAPFASPAPAPYASPAPAPYASPPGPVPVPPPGAVPQAPPLRPASYAGRPPAPPPASPSPYAPPASPYAAPPQPYAAAPLVPPPPQPAVGGSPASSAEVAPPPLPAGPPLRPSFTEGLEGVFPGAPGPSPAPAPWRARNPDRSRDLAPLPSSPDIGSHPTWDDDSSSEGGPA